MKCTWIRNLDDFIPGHAGEKNVSGSPQELRSGFQDIEQIRGQAEDVGLDGIVQVDDILYGHVAYIERKGRSAKSLQDLDVIQGIGHGRRISQSQLRPIEVGRPVEGRGRG